MTERERADRIVVLCGMVQSLRAEHAITREDLERARQALRDVAVMVGNMWPAPSRPCNCWDCRQAAAIQTAIRKGLGEP